MNDSLSGNMGLHITIGTHPSWKLNLEQELRLLKAALLYGDHVRLYSLTSSMMSMYARLLRLATILIIVVLCLS